jgi:hypothetical protein
MTQDQRAALTWYMRSYVNGWSAGYPPPFHGRTLNSLKRRRWLSGRGKVLAITSAGVKALGCNATAKAIATKSRKGRERQEWRLSRGFRR